MRARANDYRALGETANALAAFGRIVTLRLQMRLLMPSRRFSRPNPTLRPCHCRLRQGYWPGLRHTEIYNSRGLAYSALKDYDKAVADFTEAIRLRLDNAEPYKNRGIARAGMGQHSDAIDDFDLAISRKPDFEEAYVERALSYIAIREYQHSLRNLDTALKLNGQDVRAWRTHGAVKERMVDDQNAAADFSEAIQRDPGDARLYLARAPSTSNLTSWMRRSPTVVGPCNTRRTWHKLT